MKSSDDLHFHLKKLNSEKAISEKFTLQELYILFSIPPLIGANGKSYFFLKGLTPSLKLKSKATI